MMECVGRRRRQLKVGKPIVITLPVLVMNNLALAKRPADVVRDNKHMLANVTTLVGVRMVWTLHKDVASSGFVSSTEGNAMTIRPVFSASVDPRFHGRFVSADAF